MQQDLIWPGAMSAGWVFLSVFDGRFHAVDCHCNMTHMNAMDIDCTFPWTQSASQCSIYHTSPSRRRTLLPCIACLVWQNVGEEDQGLPSRSLGSPGRARREEPRRTDKPTKTGNELDGLIAKETRARRKARRTTGHYNSHKKCSGHVHRSDLMPKGNLSP